MLLIRLVENPPGYLEIPEQIYQLPWDSDTLILERVSADPHELDAKLYRYMLKDGGYMQIEECIAVREIPGHGLICLKCLAEIEKDADPISIWEASPPEMLRFVDCPHCGSDRDE